MKRVISIIMTLLCAGLMLSACSMMETIENSHEHVYSVVWSSNQDYHWKQATCEHTALKKNKQLHDFAVLSVENATFETKEKTTYACSVCGYQKTEQTAPELEHNFSDTLIYDENAHWYACIDSGYEHLKKNEEQHNLIKGELDTSTGLVDYTCDCGYSTQKLECIIITMPTILNKQVYIGQTLSSITLTGGTASVGGQFKWSNPSQQITQSGDYNVTFVPTDSQYASITQSISLTATQLTITVSVVGNGSSNYIGKVNVNYGDDLKIDFTPDSGYRVYMILVDGYLVSAEFSYTFLDIKASRTIEATFVAIENVSTGGQENTSSSLVTSSTSKSTYTSSSKKSSSLTSSSTSKSTSFSTSVSSSSSSSMHVSSGASGNESGGTTEELPFTLTCVSGTQNAYVYQDNVLTFTTINEKTVYAISGEFNGSIVFDVGESYKFDLELTGFVLSCSNKNPITVLSGEEVSLTAKNGYENFIYDKRAPIDPTDTTLYSAAIYSLVDLEICGKGKLTLISDNNNGIHTKDDLQVKNLELYIKCKDNALKGNDSVSITSANTTLISSQGDCIKTTNSHINETTQSQKGIISIVGGTHNLYAGCDGIDASYNVVIDDASTILNVYTDKYSEYSEEVTQTATNVYYLRYNSTAYKYSIKYYNSDSDYVWVNVSDTYETITSSSNRPGGSGTSYYYYTFAKNTNYTKLKVYMYSSNQTQGQESSYYACSDYVSINASYDTISLTYRSSKLSVSWTNYSTSSSNMGGMGGMQEGNSDKGTYSTKGIKAENEIIINLGTIFIKSYDDAIHSTNGGVALENGQMPTGNIIINGGAITLYSNDDGLHADGVLTINSGTIKVTNSYEGLEGTNIVVKGGSVSVTSSDDGFNTTANTGAGITISGGYVYVYAGGDGLDSNSSTSKGAIVFSGGTVVVISTSNGNAAIDCDGGYNHTGGTIIAIMSSGGMTSECTNGNTTGRTVKSSLSLSQNAYATVSVNNSVVVTIKMPVSLSSYAVYLGSSSATISSATSTSASLDANGVCWNI